MAKEYLNKSGLTHFWSKLKVLFAGKADGNTVGTAFKAEGIPYGECDSTSTATAFTATVSGISELKDGTVVILKNGVVTSASGFTLNINNLGAKPCYNNMATGNDITPTAPTRDTTIFNINYTMMFVYSSSIVSGGGWICYRGYDANTNTVGYQLRTNSTVMTVTDTARYYKLYFTSANGKQWVPASVNSTNDATSSRPVNQRPINPFGRIVYTSANTSYAAGANLAATTIWEQYPFVLGYSFNRTGKALTLTSKTPVYVKCAPQSDGSAIIDATTPYVQALPTTDDGKIYIFLGVAYDATHVELFVDHPVYYFKDGAIRLWTNAVAGGSTVSVSRTLTSGTKIGTVTVDGTGTDLYAPTPPTKVSDLTNDSGYVNATGAANAAPVQSVNGQTGAVSLTIPTVPTNVSAFTNDAGYVNATGAANAAPVQSVNGRTGAVTVEEGLAPLIGYTTDTTPSQVLNAVLEGRDVDIKYNDSDFGLLHFTSFNVAQAFGVVIGNTILYYYGTLFAFQLIGTSGSGTWELRSDILVQNSALSGYVPTTRTINSKALSENIDLTASDVGALPDTTTIPTKTSDLTNDSGFVPNVNEDFSSTGYESKSGTSGAVTIKTYTITKAGVYVFAGTGYQTRTGYSTSQQATMNGTLTIIRLNSSNVSQESYSQRAVLTGGGDCSVMAMFNCAAGDKVEFRWQQTAGTSGATLASQTMYVRSSMIRLR